MTERFDFPFVGGTKWFTLKKFNIYGFSVISSMALMVAGCYLVRAQAKNDLDVIRLSAGIINLIYCTMVEKRKKTQTK